VWGCVGVWVSLLWFSQGRKGEGGREGDRGEELCKWGWVFVCCGGGCMCVVGVGVCVFAAPLVLTNLSARVRARGNRHGR
jgi:hypothetical protein